MTNNSDPLQSFHDQNSGATFDRAHLPWSSEDAHYSNSRFDATPGVQTFEPDRGMPFYAFHARKRPIALRPAQLPVYGPEPVPMMIHEDDPGIHCKSLEDGHLANGGSSQQSGLESHFHIFSSLPGINIPPQRGGRKGQLSTKQRLQAHRTRKDRACWMCRLLKIKV
jgi:hypothetical protein